jgi:hypothetical protein
MSLDGVSKGRRETQVSCKLFRKTQNGLERGGTVFGVNPKSRIQDPESFLLKAKILWLDIEMRCAGCAVAKVESYF